MRFTIICAAVCMLAWSNPSVHAWATNLFDDSVDPHAAAAIELRCAEEHEAFRDDCAIELQRDFELGVRQPEEILRVHCTRFSNEWSARTADVNPVCEQIYGGWIES